ncbi:Endonuclease/exonuclease/phosphatase [Kribbella flavida DSM 17836]|uniref:Endonuclease/exonuclease/phosphatase n=1 Tax=Kribbella flavida (strain DSM 17836 / JCM 10339 / NBRC 14399) TaxID=479435 RepID=D2PR54_KRIFD|nr:endonuclease/exonuclease/phosphatase family protein [Kribbella flavida]ADB33002.1 Endonuclease/exonuclease/phosphatase [Kribbella flavida DSM 17836]
MRIVSVNAWGGAMFDEFVPWLETVGADVLCLQEVTRTPGAAGWTRFEDGERSLPQRANLFQDVRDLRPTDQALMVVSDTGPVTVDSGARLRQDFGVATFVGETFPVVGTHTSFVHGEYVDHVDWTIEDRPRAALATRVVDRTEGRAVTVIQLHGLRDPAGKHDTPARKTQAERLADLVEHAASPGDLIVVCGDLNLLPGSETFAVLDKLGLTDLVGTADTRTSIYPKPTRHASYLLVSDPGAVKTFEAPPHPEVSDHRPLILDL